MRYNSKTSTGQLSLSLLYEGIRYGVKGEISGNGTFSGSFTKKDDTRRNVVVSLRIKENDSGDFILDGSMTGDGARKYLSLYRNVFHKRSNPYPKAGRFTMILPRDRNANGATSTAGYGIGSTSVATSGLLKTAGYLGDGSKINISGYMSPSDEVAIFASLYGKRAVGSIGGILKFNQADNVSSANGTLHWRKSASTLAPYLKAFSVLQPTLLSPYSAPNSKAGELMISTIGAGPGNADILLGDNRIGGIRTLTWDTRNKITLVESDNEKFSVKVSTKTEIVTGTHQNLQTRVKTVFRGIVYQVQDIIVGHYFGDNRTGYMEIKSPHRPKLEILDSIDSPITNGQSISFSDTGFEGG